ncbi:sortase-like acyltransferase [Terriglobus roseus DSM 18391]|uniref:Sortase-like acyltransferase n=1 Tax=Terriglobus roseus (strain DSM 18391 / NRRL B-41598 / KBS 63) TaxID=926566 RepID=I3ZKG5_TERRK|nr:GNAT family N-acetyltransferase [Terriglobus roseus]AFL89733.1 sortase-like acyltransferase [Terriglobus roseus DSM 18391]
MPNNLRDPYRSRTATVEDAPQIALHRAKMFQDMGLLSEAELSLLRDAGEPWFASVIEDGSYLAWMLHHDTDIVGGGGMHLRPHGPMPGSLTAGLAGHIANVYIEPTHRRKGLAEALMRDMIEWANDHDIKELTLTASAHGQSIYQRLGFLPSPAFHTMKLAPPHSADQ